MQPAGRAPQQKLGVEAVRPDEPWATGPAEPSMRVPGGEYSVPSLPHRDKGAVTCDRPAPGTSLSYSACPALPRPARLAAARAAQADADATEASSCAHHVSACGTNCTVRMVTSEACSLAYPGLSLPGPPAAPEGRRSLPQLFATAVPLTRGPSGCTLPSRTLQTLTRPCRTHRRMRSGGRRISLGQPGSACYRARNRDRHDLAIPSNGLRYGLGAASPRYARWSRRLLQ